MDEMGRRIKECCLEREDAFCTSACPFHLDVREFAFRVGRGGFNAAYRAYANTVGFPAIVATLCDEPCRGVCARGGDGDPIFLRGLERAAVDFASNRKPNSYNLPAKEARIAIVGGGLGGLGCALRLTNRKYRVDIYERGDRLGGTLWDMLDPEIFLPEIERQFMYEKYELFLNTPVRDIEALAEKYDAVYVATGAGGDDFGLLKDVPNGMPFASGMKGVFLGGSLAGATKMEALAQGLQAAGTIEAYLKTDNMKSAAPYKPTRMILDPAALGKGEGNAGVRPADGVSYTKEEAVLEASRCVKCRCDACHRHCGLLHYYEKFPKRIEEETYATLNPGSLDGNSTILTRFISSCNECGLCGEVCPEEIDIGLFLRQAHQGMRAKDAMPWAFHEFWLRDMAFANAPRAALFAAPGGAAVCEYMFFPGCQLGASNPDYVTKTYDWLLQKHPDTALALYCCGAPAVWSGDVALQDEVATRIRQEWEGLGRPRAILACTSCMQFFSEFLPEIETELLYDILLKWGVPISSNAGGGRASVFDPCSSRHRRASQENVRALARQAGYELEPLPYEGARAQCCSWGGQIAIAAPNYTKWLAQQRAQEGEHPYIVYCSNCRDVFLDAGKSARHILDVVFDLDGWSRKPPTASGRRENREYLKKILLGQFWPEQTQPEATMGVGTTKKNALTMRDELREKISRARLIEEDLLSVIEACEASGRIVQAPESGHRFGYLEVGHLTHWVEYLPTDGGYELFNAYSHRMKIELEEVWHER